MIWFFLVMVIIVSTVVMNVNRRNMARQKKDAEALEQMHTRAAQNPVPQAYRPQDAAFVPVPPIQVSREKPAAPAGMKAAHSVTKPQNPAAHPEGMHAKLEDSAEGRWTDQSDWIRQRTTERKASITADDCRAIPEKDVRDLQPQNSAMAFRADGFSGRKVQGVQVSRIRKDELRRALIYGEIMNRRGGRQALRS